MKFTELKRVGVDSVIAALLLLLYGSGAYLYLPPALQLVALKTLLVSMGLLAAHISGKLLFPKVAWNCPPTAVHYARIALYVVCIYAYSLGG